MAPFRGQVTHLPARPSCRLHAATRILLWLMFAISLGTWQLPQLFLCSLVLLPLLMIYGSAVFWRLLRRSRWLLLSLLCIYALATPGSPFWAAVPAVSRAGLLSGIQQGWRLVLLFAGIGVLQAVSAADDLLYGLYTLLGRLKWLGLDAERIAIRIALTLQYVEAETPARPRNWQDRWQRALAPAADTSRKVILQSESFTWRDWVALLAMVLILLISVASVLVARILGIAA